MTWCMLLHYIIITHIIHSNTSHYYNADTINFNTIASIQNTMASPESSESSNSGPTTSSKWKIIFGVSMVNVLHHLQIVHVNLHQL